MCASSENSRESVRSLESALICADFYNSSKSKYILHLLHACVCVQGSSTRKTLVSASSENSRESVRSLESALICTDFYNSSKSKYILHLLHV